MRHKFFKIGSYILQFMGVLFLVLLVLVPIYVSRHTKDDDVQNKTWRVIELQDATGKAYEIPREISLRARFTGRT